MTPELAVEILRASEQECWLKGWDKGAAVDYVYNLAYKWAVKALEKDPCEDAVSRKAVFEAIDDCNSDGLKGIFCSYDDGERFKNYIKNLPSVTPAHSGWIPVDERPPEDGEEILMDTVHFGKITGVYDGELGFMTHYSLSSADMASVEVVAWMPLTE